MPKLTEELEHQIHKMLMFKYQLQFGTEWNQSFHKNLIPSPVQEIAEQLNVSQSAVRRIHAKIKSVGYLLRPL